MRPMNGKRGRGRGSQGGRRHQNVANRSYESNGPEIKIRGTANQVYDRYCQLARDAMASGDRVLAESYQQHAEHYYRIMLAVGLAPVRSAQPQNLNGQGDQPDGQATDDAAGDEAAEAALDGEAKGEDDQPRIEANA